MFGLANDELGMVAVIALVAALILAFVTVKIMASGLTSVFRRADAREYYVNDSLKLHMKQIGRASCRERV